MKVRASVKKRTRIARLSEGKVACMLLTRKTQSINNVKDNFIIFAKNYYSLWQ